MCLCCFCRFSCQCRTREIPPLVPATRAPTTPLELRSLTGPNPTTSAAPRNDRAQRRSIRDALTPSAHALCSIAHHWCARARGHLARSRRDMRVSQDGPRLRTVRALGEHGSLRPAHPHSAPWCRASRAPRCPPCCTCTCRSAAAALRSAPHTPQPNKRTRRVRASVEDARTAPVRLRRPSKGDCEAVRDLGRSVWCAGAQAGAAAGLRFDSFKWGEGMGV